MTDALRLAFGTLTAVRVPAPRVVDRTVAGRAMALAPLVGLVLGAIAAGVAWSADRLGAAPLVSAILVVAVLALLTRGLHLDGLADTADGLGSAKPADDALAVMSRSDIGPFGVVTLLFVVLLQIAALNQLWSDGDGPVAVVIAAVCSRVVLPFLCRRGIPAAKETGLGALVAGAVAPRLVALVVAVSAAAVIGLGAWADGGVGALHAGGALLLSLVLAAGFGFRCVRRFGGITGDVLGASVELAFLISLYLLV